MKPPLYFTHGWSNFWINCSELFPELWRIVKLILLGFPTMYFPEQGFCQVLQTGNKYRNRFDMNKIGETPFKLIDLQLALKKLANKHHRKDRSSWNEPFSEINNFCSTNAIATFFVLTWLRVCISLALNYFQHKMLFSEKVCEGGRFSRKLPTEGRFYNRLQ